MNKSVNRIILILCCAVGLAATVSVVYAQTLITDPSVASPPDEPGFSGGAIPTDMPPSPVAPVIPRAELPVLSLPVLSLDVPENMPTENAVMDQDFFFDPMNPNGLPAEGYDPDRAFQAMSNAEGQGASVEPAEAVEENVPTPYSKQDVNPNSIPSMLFTVWEYNTLQEAQKNIGRALVRPIEDFEVGEEPEAVSRPPPEERYISLAGIVYGGRKSWTIWLNGQRVTPQALPEEILDLKVYREYIEIKWFDEYTRGIFPIRIKPHQRFNLDTRIFLPG
jgi:hypothetical protein